MRLDNPPERLIGQIKEREGLWLRRSARKVPAGECIVEIGSYTGKSTSCLAVGSAEGHEVSVFAVDFWHTGTLNDRNQFVKFDHHQGPQSSSKFHRREVYETFTERMRTYDVAGVVVPLMGDSVEQSRDWLVPIGLLFIDAGHTAEEVARDFDSWSPHLSKTGTVVFHDYREVKHSKRIAVRNFVDQLSDEWEVTRYVRSMAIVQRRNR